MSQPGPPEGNPLEIMTLRTRFLGRPRSRHDHMDALDGLRGLAVLIVLGSHLSNSGLLPQPGLSGSGKGGVYLFFTLSAFLLTRALLRRPLADFGRVRHWADYALRRVLRIWPLYLLLLLVSWLLTCAGVDAWHYQMDTAGLWRHLTLQEGQSVLWSIPVEFVFYFWLPLVALALACMQAWRWPWWIEAIAVVLALLLVYVSWPPAETPPNDVRLGPYLAVFLCGAYAARVHLRLQALPSPLRKNVWVIIAVVALAAWVLTIPIVWAWLTGKPFVASVSSTWFIWFGLIWSALLLAVLHGPDWLRKPFAWQPLRLVGVVSFSLYLWHMPVIDAFHRLGAHSWPLLGPCLVVVASLLIAMLSFLFFERPWREVRLRQIAGVKTGAGVDSQQQG